MKVAKQEFQKVLAMGRHILNVDMSEDKYTLRLDGKIINTDFGQIKNKSLEYLFVGLASIEDKVFAEGIIVQSGDIEGKINLDAKEFLNICCKRYEQLATKNLILQDFCYKTKKQLEEIAKDTPEFEF